MKHNMVLHNIIDLTEEDRDKLLEMLWNKSSNLGQSRIIYFDIMDAKEEINSSKGYVNNICGRYININLYVGDIVNSYEYDKINGSCMFKIILERLRENKKNKDISVIGNELGKTHI